MQNKTIRLLCSLVFFASVGLSALNAAEVPKTPFSRGVNLSGWFEVDSPRAIQFTRYAKRDFAELKALGCDVIRLPINLKAMTSGAPDYRIDPLFLSFLDEAVSWAEELGIHIIVDNHTFNPNIPTERDIEKILLAEWKQLAARYRDRSDFVLYEVLNEPHGIDCARWAKIQGRVVAAIREIDPRHAIIVGSANFNSYRDLTDLPKYPHDNIIYTFHFYDPMVFTHQGAVWLKPSMESLVGVPFPYDQERMPMVPKKLQGTWIDYDLRGYSAIATPEKIETLLDGPARFARERNVPVFCGEFGVHMPGSPADDRVVWHRLVREALEKRGLSWALWDVYGIFGIFKTPLGGSVESDLNVPLVEALGLKAPPQRNRAPAPVSGRLSIFSDYPGEGILLGQYANGGSADFYAVDAPETGKYVLRWGGCDRYGSVYFNFQRPLDLSALARDGYALVFSARVDKPGAAVELRFRDTNNPPIEKPWRMCVRVDDANLPADGAWHRVRIPLSEMRETGAWIGEWIDGSGLFSWSRVAAFEIVAEHQALKGITYSFDDIAIEK
jgi:endoglucanase